MPSYWISKYALTRGVFVVEGEVTEHPAMLAVDEGRRSTYYHKPYWHTTELAALQHALEMVKARQVSLAKQQAKMTKLQRELELETFSRYARGAQKKKKGESQ